MGVLRPHCCGLYGTEEDEAFLIIIGDETTGEAAYVEGDGVYGEKGRFEEMALAGVWWPCRYDAPCGGASEVVRRGGCTAMRLRGDVCGVCSCNRGGAGGGGGGGGRGDRGTVYSCSDAMA